MDRMVPLSAFRPFSAVVVLSISWPRSGQVSGRTELHSDMANNAPSPRYLSPSGRSYVLLVSYLRTCCCISPNVRSESVTAWRVGGGQGVVGLHTRLRRVFNSAYTLQ